LISPSGPPHLLYRLWQAGRFELVTSESQIRELERVLARPRLQKYLSQAEGQRLMALISSVAVLVEEPLPEVQASADPDDDVILGTALVGRADLIVSGDQRGLIALNEFRGTRILSPTAALASLHGA